MIGISSIVIYFPNNSGSVRVTLADSSVRVRRIMAENYVQIDFASPNYIDIPVGSVVWIGDWRYTKTRRQTPTFNGAAWQYSEQFDDADGDLRRYRIKYYGQDFQEMSFALTATLADFARLIIKDINKELGGETYGFVWRLGDIDAPLADSLKTISFAGDTLFDACTSIAQEFETEWFISRGEYVPSGAGYYIVYLNFRKRVSGVPTDLEIGSGKILSQMNPQRGDDAEFGTRFFVFGGTRNLTDDYKEVPAGTSVPNLYENRLRLPNGKAYIDAKNGQIVQDLTLREVIEQYVTLDDVFPKNRDTITAVDSREVVDEQGNRYTQYTIQADDCPFAGKGDIIDELGIKFETGELAGQEFVARLESEQLPWNKRLIVVAKNMGTDGQVLYVPNPLLKPSVGDVFVLTGVKLQTSKVRDAENELLAKAEDYARQHSSDTDVYECVSNPVYCYENNVTIGVGSPVRLVNADLFGANGRSSRIQAETYSLTKPYEATWEVGDNTKYSRFGNLSTTLEEVKYSQRLGIIDTSLLNLIRSTDYSSPSDENIFTALAAYNHIYKKHDHKGRLIRPAIFVIPHKSPAEEGTSLDDNEIAEWLAPEGNYPETPGGGVAAVYDLTIKAGQTALGIYQPGVEPKAIDLSPLIEGLASEALVRQLIATAIASAIKYAGISSTVITDGGTQRPTIDGEQVTPKRGDAVIYEGFEFLWTGAKWQKLGDETSYALKTILIQAGSGLTGGGDLTQSRTIALSDSTIEKLNKADTAVQPAALDNYLPLSAGQNKALTGHLYTRNVLPSSDKGGNLGSATNRYNCVYTGSVDGGNGDMGFWRMLKELRKSFFFAGANKLNIGEGYAESNLPTNLFGSVITLHIGATKVAMWQIDADGNLVPYNASTDVDLGSSAKRVNGTYTKTLNVSGQSTLNATSITDADITGSLAIPTAPPANPTAGKTYLYLSLNGNYVE